jgi:hypothetical protein
MADEKLSIHAVKSFYRIRRCILTTLYHYFKEVPYAAIELSQIAEDCHVGAKELNWNIVYLEKSGFVELARSHAEPPFVSPSAVITAEGINLIEDDGRLDKRFPLSSDAGHAVAPEPEAY